MGENGLLHGHGWYPAPPTPVLPPPPSVPPPPLSVLPWGGNGHSLVSKKNASASYCTGPQLRPTSGQIFRHCGLWLGVAQDLYTSPCTGGPCPRPPALHPVPEPTLNNHPESWIQTKVS